VNSVPAELTQRDDQNRLPARQLNTTTQKIIPAAATSWTEASKVFTAHAPHLEAPPVPILS
jgi:hypothetical protein